MGGEQPYSANNFPLQEIIKAVYPVGIVVEFGNATDPNESFPGTKWEKLPEGLVIVSAGSTFTINSTGGEATHTLTIDEMPSHAHEPIPGVGVSWTQELEMSTFSIVDSMWNEGNKGRTVVSSFVGGNQPHNNMQPYVCKNCWERTQ